MAVVSTQLSQKPWKQCTQDVISMVIEDGLVQFGIPYRTNLSSTTMEIFIISTLLLSWFEINQPLQWHWRRTAYFIQESKFYINRVPNRKLSQKTKSFFQTIPSSLYLIQKCSGFLSLTPTIRGRPGIQSLLCIRSVGSRFPLRCCVDEALGNLLPVISFPSS